MKTTLWLIPFHCLVLCIAAACGTKPPANELEAVKYTGTIKVGTSAVVPPFQYLNEVGEIAGFDIDLVVEIAKRMGVRVEIQNLPYEQLVPALRDGKIDIAIAALNNTSLSNQPVGYTDAYINLAEGMLEEKRSMRPEIVGGPLFIAVPEGAAELAHALNRIIAEMKAGGFIEDLSIKYHLESR